LIHPTSTTLSKPSANS